MGRLNKSSIRSLSVAACATVVLLSASTRSNAETVLECRGRARDGFPYFTVIVDKNSGSLTVLHKRSPLPITNIRIQSSIIEFEFTYSGIHAHRRIWPDGTWNQDLYMFGRLQRNEDGGHCRGEPTKW